MIIWVDDDLNLYTRSFRYEIEDGGYEIETFHKPDNAINFFRENASEISGAIIDIMLPTGDFFTAEETNMGTQTGKLLIEEFIKIGNIVGKKIPMLIFSISNNNQILAWAKNEGIPYLLKQETFPRELLEKIEEIGVKKDIKNEIQ